MHIERPESGRAIIREEGGGLGITIPTRKSPSKIFVIIFLCAWMGGWVFGESFAVRELITSDLPFGAMGFLLFWLIGWTIGGIVIIGIILWFIFGKERITFNQGVLTLENKGLGIGRTRRYAVSDIKNFRIFRPENYSWGNSFNFSRYGMGRGTIAFDYGMKTVRFASDIDEAEAIHLLDLIKQRSEYFR